LVAFATAATPFTILGISSGFWSVVTGLAASYLVERRELRVYWKRQKYAPN
jgi:predicted benzoate:H+ symporter BenE